MYLVRSTKAYRKAHKRISRHKDFDQQILDEVVDTLSQDKKLDAKYHDHQLVGEFAGYRECHIKNDILLLYRKENEILILLLVDLGSHSQLFGK